MTVQPGSRPTIRGATVLVALVAGSLVCSALTASATAAPGAATSARSAVSAGPVSATVATAGAAKAAAPTSTAVVRCKVRPTMSVPKGRKAGKGQRIIYSQRRMHVWVMDKNNCVVRDYKVTGRADWPRVGSYKVFSKSRSSRSTKYHVTFNYMVRFAHGRTTSIGFHDIPKKNGRPIQTVSSLGRPLGLGGCVRAAPKNAKWLYTWAKVGTRVYVVR